MPTAPRQPGQAHLDESCGQAAVQATKALGGGGAGGVLELAQAVPLALQGGGGRGVHRRDALHVQRPLTKQSEKGPCRALKLPAARHVQGFGSEHAPPPPVGSPPKLQTRRERRPRAAALHEPSPTAAPPRQRCGAQPTSLPPQLQSFPDATPLCILTYWKVTPPEKSSHGSSRTACCRVSNLKAASCSAMHCGKEAAGGSRAGRGERAPCCRGARAAPRRKHR